MIGRAVCTRISDPRFDPAFRVRYEHYLDLRREAAQEHLIREAQKPVHRVALIRQFMMSLWSKFMPKSWHSEQHYGARA